MLLWDPRHSPRGPAGRGGPRCLSVRVLPVENETAVRGTAGMAAGPGSVCPHHRPLPRPLTHHWTGEPSVPRKATQSRRAILPGEAGGARVSLKSEPWVSLGAGQRQGAGLGRVWRRVCNAPESFGATWAAATHVCPLRGLGLLVRLLRERGHGQGVGSIAPSEHTPSWRHVKL